MSLSINPLEIFKILKQDRADERARIIQWLEAVRQEARGLSDAWLQICDELEKTDECDPGQYALAPFRARLSMQAIYASRLEEFYGRMSQITGATVSSRTQETLIHQLASILRQRKITRAGCEEMLAGWKSPKSAFFLDAENRSTSIANLRDAVAALQRELAALDVFIQALKSAPKLSG